MDSHFRGNDKEECGNDRRGGGNDRKKRGDNMREGDNISLIFS